MGKESLKDVRGGFPDGSAVKNLPAMQETSTQSLCQKDPLEEEMATHSSILAGKSVDRGACWLQFLGSQNSWTLLNN